MENNTRPIVFRNDGTFVECDSFPSFSCFQDLAPNLVCWDQASNCWGALMNTANGFAAPIQNTFCTIDTCPLDTFKQAHFDYIPTLPGNALFAGIFAVILLIQLVLVLRYRTWSFFVGMAGGLVLECVGYIGRILIHNDPFAKNPFLIYLICLTIGPAFLSASIYSCLGRIVIVYGESLSRLRPSTYSKIFIPCDVVSLILQAVGGALASTASDQAALNRGTNIMIAGLSFQVFSLLLFLLFCADLALSIARSAAGRGRGDGSPPPLAHPDGARVRGRAMFTFFLYAIAISTLAIFVRSVFRVAELSKGFHGPLDNQQVTYMVLEGVMIILAVTVLTVGHPGWAFDGLWSQLKSHKGGYGKEGHLADRDGNGSGSGSGSGNGSLNGRGQGVEVGHY